MGLSEEQHGIVHSNFKEIMTVKAYAGTGKSFTLKQFCKKHSDKTFIYFVYNKSMRIDAEKSFKEIDNVLIVTFHGVGFRTEGVKYKERLDKEESLRTFDLIPYIIGKHIEEDRRVRYAHALLSLIQKFISTNLTIEDYVKILKKKNSTQEIPDEDIYAFVINKVEKVWNDIIKPDGTLPFEHDYYLKLFQLSQTELRFNYNISKRGKKELVFAKNGENMFDFILVDEAQDISPVMIDIILSQKGKKIFVGDSFQSIYSWRGAVNSLDLIEKVYSPSVYYLSNSFRCPPRVAWLANRVIKLAGAEKDFVGVAEPAEVTKQKTYIARTNSGLFGFCVENIDRKIYFVGGVKSYNFQDLIDIQNLISQKHEYIRNDFIAKFTDFKELNKYAKEMHDISMIGTIGIVLKYMKKNIYELIKGLKEAATTDMKEANLVVTTAHKSKGLEWSLVELIDDFPFGNEAKMERADVGEELRLLYVAITRAMNSVRLPEEILDYLDITQGRSEFMGTVTTTQDGKIDEDEFDEVGDDPIELCHCSSCGQGSVLQYGSKYACESCDFQIAAKKIIGFFSNFDYPIDNEDANGILKSLIVRGGYSAKGLISKENKPFNAVILLKKDESYGWGLKFKDKK